MGNNHRQRFNNHRRQCQVPFWVQQGTVKIWLNITKGFVTYGISTLEIQMHATLTYCTVLYCNAQPEKNRSKAALLYAMLAGCLYTI